MDIAKLLKPSDRAPRAPAPHPDHLRPDHLRPDLCMQLRRIDPRQRSSVVRSGACRHHPDDAGGEWAGESQVIYAGAPELGIPVVPVLSWRKCSPYPAQEEAQGRAGQDAGHGGQCLCEDRPRRKAFSGPIMTAGREHPAECLQHVNCRGKKLT